MKDYIANAFNEAILTYGFEKFLFLLFSFVRCLNSKFSFFSNSNFSDEHRDLLTYTIPSKQLKWSAVFEMMENGKKTGNIEDYSVSQNSLEQVLLSFVKNQRARNDQKKDSRQAE